MGFILKCSNFILNVLYLFLIIKKNLQMTMMVNVVSGNETLHVFFVGSVIDFLWWVLLFVQTLSHYCRGTKFLIVVNLHNCCLLLRNPLITAILQFNTGPTYFFNIIGIVTWLTSASKRLKFRFLSLFINVVHLQ